MCSAKWRGYRSPLSALPDESFLPNTLNHCQDGSHENWSFHPAVAEPTIGSPSPSIAPRSQRNRSTNPHLLKGYLPQILIPANGSTGHQHPIPRSRFFTRAPRLFPGCSQCSRKAHERKYCLECKGQRPNQLGFCCKTQSCRENGSTR